MDQPASKIPRNPDFFAEFSNRYQSSPSLSPSRLSSSPPLPPPDELLLPARSQPGRQTKLILLAIIATLSIVPFLGYQIFRSRSNTSSDQISPVQPPLSPTPSPHKEYTNTEFFLKLSYPTNITLEIVSIPDSDQLQLIFNQDQSDQFTFTASKNYLPDDATSFLNSSPTSRRVIADNLWNAFYLPPQSSSPENTFTGFALRLENNSILYTFIFPNQTDTTNNQDQILSTFQLTD